MKIGGHISGWICFLLIIFAFGSVSTAGTGDLQVFSEQGLQIYIDDVLAGTTNGFDRGLFVEGLEPGPHTLRAERDGFEPILKRFNITGYRSRVITIDLEDMRQLEDKNSAIFGILVLRSAPMGASIFIDDIYRGQTDITIEDVKEGSHRVRFERDGSGLEGDFPLKAEETLTLKAHFRDAVIIDLSAIEQEERAKETEETAFNEAVRVGSGHDVGAAVFAWSRFLESYPGGVYTQEGREQLALWEERQEKNLSYFNGEWMAADTAADRLKDQGADWVQLDVGISLDDMTVAYVTPGSPAGKAGILAGDVILEVDKKRMKKVGDVQKSLKKGKKEKKRLVLIRRSGRTVFVEIMY